MIVYSSISGKEDKTAAITMRERKKRATMIANDRHLLAFPTSITFNSFEINPGSIFYLSTTLPELLGEENSSSVFLSVRVYYVILCA